MRIFLTSIIFFFFLFFKIDGVRAFERQLQVHDNALYFVTPEANYELSSHFLPTKIELKPLYKQNMPSMYGQLSKINDIYAVPYQEIQSKCKFSVTSITKLLAAGSITCNFFSENKTLNYTIDASYLRGSKPYLSYDNFKIKDEYYLIGISTGEDASSNNVSYIEFSKYHAPRQIHSSLDCANDISEYRYQWGNLIFCKNALESSWFARTDNTGLSFPMPCTAPDSLLAHNKKLWALQNNDDGTSDICQYNSDFNDTEKHYRYTIDTDKTFKNIDYPELTVTRILPLKQEIDNGSIIGYKLLLKDLFLISPDHTLISQDNEILAPHYLSEIIQKEGESWAKAVVIPISSAAYKIDSN